MGVRLWTRRVPKDFPYELLVKDAGCEHPSGIAMEGTPLGRGVGVEDSASGRGFLAFDCKDGEYIAYYWRKA